MKRALRAFGEWRFGGSAFGLPQLLRSFAMTESGGVVFWFMISVRKGVRTFSGLHRRASS